MPAIPDPMVRAQRVQALVASATRRLEPLCRHMPAADFSAMVQAIAERSYVHETAVPVRWWRGRGT